MQVLYTDGGCRGNPGPGGWGCWYRNTVTHDSIAMYGGEKHTTNNRMELMAVICGLELAQDGPITIYLDSKYVQNGATKWIPNWKARGWRSSMNKPIKNIDLWKRLDALIHNRPIKWKWVAGHSGHLGNEAADALANRGMDELHKHKNQPYVKIERKTNE